MVNPFVKYLNYIVLVGIGCTLVFAVTWIFLPKQYKAESQVVIISRDRTGVDPYTQAKSAERIGENLAQVMKTSDFYNKVIQGNSPFDKASWQQLGLTKERQQRKKWQKDVVAEMVYGSSILKISVYSATSAEAKLLSTAVTQTLVASGSEYVGGDVALKQVDTPLVSLWPARPNIVLFVSAGLILGIILGSLWVARYKTHTLFGKM